jgi:hypothetical protein
MGDARVGWRTIKGRWYEGWTLLCTTDGRPVTYFVPDTTVAIIGPKLRSRTKLLVLAAVLACVVLLSTIAIVWQRDRERAQSEAEHQQAAAAAKLASEQQQEREKNAASERAQRQVQEQAKQREKREEETKEAAIAFETNRAATTRDIGTLESLVRHRKWDEAEEASRLLDSQFAAVLRPESSLASEQWVLDIHARLTKQQEFIAADKERRLQKERVVAERARQVAEKQAEKERTAVAKREAAAAAVEAICGSKPDQSSWDGMLLAVDRYMKDNLNDPSSYEGLGCTTPVLTTTSCWVATCKFRAANAFGAKILQVKRFSIGKHPTIEGFGRVLSVSD